MEIKYKLEYTKKAIRDIQNIKATKFTSKVKKLCEGLQYDAKPDCSKSLSRDLKGKRSIRINIQHRIVYEIFEEQKIIKVLSMWSHY
jgi:Txe/YoeB family toxin of toxin-antitoxin system